MSCYYAPPLAACAHDELSCEPRRDKSDPDGQAFLSVSPEKEVAIAKVNCGDVRIAAGCHSIINGVFGKGGLSSSLGQR